MNPSNAPDDEENKTGRQQVVNNEDDTNDSVDDRNNTMLFTTPPLAPICNSSSAVVTTKNKHAIQKKFIKSADCKNTRDRNNKFSTKSKFFSNFKRMTTVNKMSSRECHYHDQERENCLLRSGGNVEGPPPPFSHCFVPRSRHISINDGNSSMSLFRRISENNNSPQSSLYGPNASMGEKLKNRWRQTVRRLSEGFSPSPSSHTSTSGGGVQNNSSVNGFDDSIATPDEVLPDSYSGALPLTSMIKTRRILLDLNQGSSATSSNPTKFTTSRIRQSKGEHIHRRNVTDNTGDECCYDDDTTSSDNSTTSPHKKLYDDYSKHLCERRHDRLVLHSSASTASRRNLKHNSKGKSSKQKCASSQHRSRTSHSSSSSTSSADECDISNTNENRMAYENEENIQTI